MSPSLDSYGASATLNVAGRSYTYYSLPFLEGRLGGVSRLPFSLRILLENLVRNEDGITVHAGGHAPLAAWDPKNVGENEIAFRPARVLMQDLTGVPAIVDLAAMRDAMVALGGDPRKINPLAARRAGDRPLGAGGRVRYVGAPSRATPRWSWSATANGMRLLRWGQRRWQTSRSYRPTPASCTRSTSNAWHASSSGTSATACCWPTPTPSSAPTPTRR